MSCGILALAATLRAGPRVTITSGRTRPRGETRHPPGQCPCHQRLRVEVPGSRVTSDRKCFGSSMNLCGRTARERQAIWTRGDRHAVDRAMGAVQDAEMRDLDDGERNPMVVISEMVLVGPRVAESGLGGETA
jgi:hypothetical protein